LKNSNPESTIIGNTVTEIISLVNYCFNLSMMGVIIFLKTPNLG